MDIDRGQRVVLGLEAADPDETAAVIAALQAYLSHTGQPMRRPDVWARAGRLEAQGLQVTRRAMQCGWRG